MKKKLKIFLILITILASINKLEASFLWNIQQGIDLYQNGEVENAKKYLKTYEKYNPNDEKVYFLLSEIYLNSDNANEKETLSKKYLKTFYELNLKEKNIEKIKFEKKSNINQEDYFDMAIMYFEEGNFFEANYYADLILKENPKSASAYFIKAKLAQLSKKEKEAKEFLKNAIIYNNSILKTNLAKSLNIYDIPQLTKEMYLSLSQEAFYNFDFDTAINNANECIKIDSQNQNAYILLIDSYLAKKDISKAKEVLSCAKNILKDNVQLNLASFKIAQQEKNHFEKKSALEKAYKLNPNNDRVLNELGNLYLEEKNYQKANELFQNLIIHNDKMYEARFNYTYSLIKIGKIDEAIKQSRFLPLLNKNQSEFNYLLGLICMSKGEIKNAKEYFINANKEDENEHYYYEIAKIEYLEKDYYSSKENIEKALKLTQDEDLTSNLNDLLIKVLLNMKEFNLAKNLIFKQQSLDKNRLTYKYNLYVLYKLSNNDVETKRLFKELQKEKPSSLQDFLDLSEFYYSEFNEYRANDFLEKGIKKYPKEIELYNQKLKFAIFSENEKFLKTTILEMKNIFNCPQG